MGIREWIDLASQSLQEDVVPFPGSPQSPTKDAEASSEMIPIGDLDHFTRAYMGAAVMDWYHNRRNPDRSWQWSDTNKVRSLSPEDIDRPTQMRMVQDCKAFMQKNGALLRKAAGTLHGRSKITAMAQAKAMAGKQYYVGRGGNGQEQPGEIWQRLRDVAATFGPVTLLYMGQDLKLHSESKVVK